MGNFFKGILSIVLHFSAGFGICVVAVFFREDPAVLPFSVTAWKFATACLLFIKYMPALICASILTGYAIIFGRSKLNPVTRCSREALQYLHDVFTILCLCIALFLMLTEIATPRLVCFQHKSEATAFDYYSFIKKGNTALQHKDFESTYFNANEALLRWHTSTDAALLRDKAKMYIAKKRPKLREQKIQHNSNSFEHLTTQSTLQTAMKAFQKKDFYAAHFYARHALRLSKTDAVIHNKAQTIAAESWQQIKTAQTSLTEVFDMLMYEKKQEAYQLMQADNALKAYYKFLEIASMIAKHEEGKKDPDVERCLATAREKLLQQAFFIDEIEHLPVIETVRNIHFTLPIHNSGTLQFKIKTLTIRGNSKNILGIYGNHCEVTRYNEQNTIVFRHTIPLVKLLPISINEEVSHGSSIQNEPFKPLKTNKNNKPAMRLIFQSLDRMSEQTYLSKPLQDYTQYTQQSGAINLPLSLFEFMLIIKACQSEKAMTIPELYYFWKISDVYGFNTRIYICEILIRIIGIPFALLIAGILLLIMAWRFRISPNTAFKNTNLLVIPLYIGAAFVLVETLQYLFRLLILICTDFYYPYLTWLVFPLFIGLVVLVSMLFIAQQSKVDR